MSKPNKILKKEDIKPYLQWEKKNSLKHFFYIKRAIKRFFCIHHFTDDFDCFRFNHEVCVKCCYRK